VGVLTELVLRKDEDGLCILAINRPEKMNALNLDVFVELRSHVDDLEKCTDTIGCVVLKGNGACFSAGHDLRDIVGGKRPPYENYQSETIGLLANLPQPVISAVHGHCYTGGLELALAGDIIIAAKSARFADTHAKWGLSPLWGMSQRLPRRIGTAKAKEMMFTSRIYTAEEALGMGLANMCVADEKFEEEILSLAGSILSNSWFSNRGNKRLIMKTEGMALEDGLRYEIEHNPGRAPDAKIRLNAPKNRE
jgi:enoyl-CoA hydratase/carnithine racemase